MFRPLLLRMIQSPAFRALQIVATAFTGKVLLRYTKATIKVLRRRISKPEEK